MIYLLIVSLLWAFSFGLIKGNLTGINPYFVAFTRMALSSVCFLPLLKPIDIKVRLLSVGAIQFGLMYIFYLAAYQYLRAFEIALFTIFTPIYVSAIADFFEGSFSWLNITTSALAVVACGIYYYHNIAADVVVGFFLVQLSNICFAFGQVAYRRLVKDREKDYSFFAYLYLGAFALTLASALFFGGFEDVHLTSKHIWTLLYLGLLPSGVGFFVWNYGTRKTTIGVVAIFNNLKIPLAVGVSLLFFGESANTIKLLICLFLMLIALYLNQKYRKNETI